MKNAISAGGVIVNPINKKVFILKRKNSNWVLPKGHLEKGESPEEAAIREVKEETNLNVKIIDFIGKTHYIAPATEKHPEEDKTVLWYLMESYDSNNVKIEEDVFSDGRFLYFNDAYNLLTFEQEKEILRRGYELYMLQKGEKKLHVLMLSWEYPPRIVGGLSRHVKDLSDALAERDTKVSIITCGTKDAPWEENKNNLSVYRVPEKIIDTPNFISWIYFLNLSMMIKALEINRTNPIDIIHAHDWLSAFAGYVLKHSLKKPLLSTIHATEHGRNQGIYTEEQKFIHNVEWWLTYESWKVIVCSNNMKDEVMFLFNLPYDKIKIIPNGINPENLKTTLDYNEVRSKFLNQDEKMILFIGRMHYQKGADYLLRSIPYIINDFPKVKFIFVGTGPQLDYLIEESKNLGINEKVIFTGFVDDNLRNALLHASDICVFPSIYEPFGIVALEAMALGKPVVASRLGGFAEIIEDGIDGILFEPKNILDLANKIKMLLYNDDLREKIGKMAIKKALEKYSWKSIAEETKKVYFEVYREYLKTDW